ncbi:MAG: hypothetical protein OXU77_16195 [Gammaproteobacteria bacterium]|nr:hypothetical protein [Gammaproteobacteria bacterium]
MLDGALEESLTETVREAGQPETVARRLTAWLRQMSQGPLAKEDDARFLMAVCDVLELEDDDAD